MSDVHHVQSQPLLERLNGLHVLSSASVEQRFQYRQPSLFVLVGRAYSMARPHVISDQPYFGGCRSWVELPDELPTAGLEAALPDAEFAAPRQRVRQALAA